MAYTWLEFKNLVKRLTSDGAINDTAAVLAISRFVKAAITLQVDKAPDLATGFQKLWEEEKRRLLGYGVTLGDPQLREAVNKLLTVDANRYGVAEAGGFIDTLIAQAKNEIAGQAPWYDNQIRQACIELQHYVEYFRSGHETIYTSDDVTEDGEASVGELPEESRPQEAYYAQVGEQCDRVPINQYDWQNRYDLICGNKKISCDGFYMAIDPLGGTFLVFPKILPGKYVSLNWDGNKIQFTEGEKVPFDEKFAETCAQFLLWKIYLRPTTRVKDLSEIHEKAYLRARAQLYRDGREKTQTRYRNSSPDPEPCDLPCGVSCAPGTPEESQVEFVFLADSGDEPTLANTEAVANLAKSFEPDFIIHGGDTNYPNANPVNFQDYFFKFYRGWIDHGDMYQAWGNHDLESQEGNQYGRPLLNLYPNIAELNGGKLYYKFTRGPLNFFVYNTGFSDQFEREPDGIGLGSVQANWLLNGLEASGTGINIVVMHRAPWTSDPLYSPGSPVLQNMAIHLKDAGAHLVLCGHGHQYERLMVVGLPFIVVGTGGAPLRKLQIGQVVSGSQFRYYEKHGLLRVSGTENQVKTTFVTTDKEVIDTLTVKVEAVVA